VGAAGGAEVDGDEGAGVDAGADGDAMADGDVAAADDGADLPDELGTADGLAVAELPELCCADTTAEPQPAAARTAASTSTDTADDRPRIADLPATRRSFA
jgi:hypothetical protein